MNARMLSETPHASPFETPILDAPDALVARYLALCAQRRQVEDQLAFLRAELEVAAAAALSDDRPRGRFVAPGGGAVAARLYPTCSFDRAEVGRALQRMGRLDQVAVIQPIGLARFLEKEPQVRARLGPLVRPRTGVMLTASPGAAGRTFGALP